MHSTWKGCPQNDLYCVGWDVKPYSLTHSYRLLLVDRVIFSTVLEQHTLFVYREFHGFYGEGKSGKVGEKSNDQRKSGNFTFQSQGKFRGSGNLNLPGCNLS